MSETIKIIDSDDGPRIETPDYASMTLEELSEYAAVGREQAIAEIIRRQG